MVGVFLREQFLKLFLRCPNRPLSGNVKAFYIHKITKKWSLYAP